MYSTVHMWLVRAMSEPMVWAIGWVYDTSDDPLHLGESDPTDYNQESTNSLSKSS